MNTIAIRAPRPITKWETSDGKVHETEDMARRHEVFLRVKHLLPNHSGTEAYSTVLALAGHFDFVERAK